MLAKLKRETLVRQVQRNTSGSVLLKMKVKRQVAYKVHIKEFELNPPEIVGEPQEKSSLENAELLAF